MRTLLLVLGLVSVLGTRTTAATVSPIPPADSTVVPSTLHSSTDTITALNFIFPAERAFADSLQLIVVERLQTGSRLLLLPLEYSGAYGAPETIAVVPGIVKDVTGSFAWGVDIGTYHTWIDVYWTELRDSVDRLYSSTRTDGAWSMPAEWYHSTFSQSSPRALVGSRGAVWLERDSIRVRAVDEPYPPFAFGPASGGRISSLVPEPEQWSYLWDEEYSGGHRLVVGYSNWEPPHVVQVIDSSMDAIVAYSDRLSHSALLYVRRDMKDSVARLVGGFFNSVLDSMEGAGRSLVPGGLGYLPLVLRTGDLRKKGDIWEQLTFAAWTRTTPESSEVRVRAATDAWPSYKTDYRTRTPARSLPATLSRTSIRYDGQAAWVAWAEPMDPGWTVKGYVAHANQVTGDVPPRPVPEVFEVRQNFPNPFNPTTTVEILLVGESPVKTVIENVLGQQVAVLHDGPLTAGPHEFVWDATSFPTGTYFCRVTVGTVSKTLKLLLIK